MNKFANGQSVIAELNTLAPKHLAEEGDPIGLQVGNLNKPVKKVMIALDVLEEVVDEAIETGAELIIAHHPMIYRPLKKIDLSMPQGRIIEKLIKNDIAVYAAHTNLDVAKGGVNDWLAQALGLEQTEVLKGTREVSLVKLAVYVPEDYADTVRVAMSAAGAGHIGQYSHCTFNTTGEGTFKPLEGTKPFIGTQGQIERVKEIKVETVISEDLVKPVVSSMKKAHPYEEVAYDLYQLENQGETLGIGKIGRLAREMSFEQFIQHVKETLDVPSLRAVKGHSGPIRKVAVVGGDGNKFISAAIMKGADVLVTGDMYYHNAHDAQAAGLSIIDPGHNVEKIMKRGLCEYLTDEMKRKGYATEFFSSEVHTDPFLFF
ncbi:Nif3-like dinuclear metal center hexameric protein [Fictibacillus terranigra]|uniref:GTP cyclohydrolase 1 type 2 homolog n=1 Tax=Fictibacillus terranigra TaxID=3058424 RepID=A0ABT8EA79_9BACL|nr:Nif3-like dinuclear metal center hexameric protein [Fictibacillus sp. CENA-BCM004]MDN4074787.1 Nif3-like dinuclear metal center hexameric protein [Fictibacillus sp. CENA-BCM004]